MTSEKLDRQEVKSHLKTAAETAEGGVTVCAYYICIC